MSGGSSEVAETEADRPSALEDALLYQLISEDAHLRSHLEYWVASFLDRARDGEIFLNEEIFVAAAKRYVHLREHVLEKTKEIDLSPSDLTTFMRERQLLPRPIADANDAIPHSLPQQQQHPQKRVKILIDGVFDLMHMGHFNAIRQASLLGDELHVGVCTDEEAFKAKRVYPLYSLEERMAVVRACKWVSRVLVTPYDITLPILESTGCDYAAHGDDIALTHDGKDCYTDIKAAGRLKIFPRTRGISTTTLVSRLMAAADAVPRTSTSFMAEPLPVELFVTRNSSCDPCEEPTVEAPGGGGQPGEAHEVSVCRRGANESNTSRRSTAESVAAAVMPLSPAERLLSPPEIQNLLSTRRLAQFITHRKRPADARVVYSDGSFDTLHEAHIRHLEKAKALGDWLIVGVYDDDTVRMMKGLGYPIQSMLERTMCILAMRVVDDVLMGVPPNPTEELVKQFGIHVVTRGTICDSKDVFPPSNLSDLKGCCDVSIIDSDIEFTTESLINRIRTNRAKLDSAIAMRKEREAKWHASSHILRDV